MSIINVYDSFKVSGGAQFVVITLHKFFQSLGYNSYLCSFDTKIYNTEHYIKLSPINFFVNRKKIFISHHRKTTSILILYKLLFVTNTIIIHVAHNEFYNLRFFTLFPKNIIAVSGKVKKNLINYFGIKENRIRIIQNGIKDIRSNVLLKKWNPNNIRILYPARITSVKGQVELVLNLKGKIHDNVLIDFAGDGEQSNILSDLCKNDRNFNYIGFVNIHEVIDNYDFILLFSKKEGLPISLIEATMYGKPIITNDVGGNLEIVSDGYNGLIRQTYFELSQVFNSLHDLSENSISNMSKNSRSLFESSFVLDKMVQAYNDYILDVVKKSKIDLY